jgi:SulP family sulfate permease
MNPAAHRIRAGLRTYLPILTWLPSYQSRWLRADVVAGLTVWAILVPESVAYAQLAGVPAVAALSLAPGVLLAYALFGSSRLAIVGGDSALAIMSTAVVGPLAMGSSTRYGALTAALAILAGILALSCGICRLGFVASFLSRSVMTGFMFGLSMVVAIGQLPKLLGVKGTSGNFFERSAGLAQHLDHTNGWTLLIGAASLAILFGLRALRPHWPAALIAVAGSTLTVALLTLAHHGVAIVGAIPAGLPRLGVPDISSGDVTSLFPGALGIVLVAYAEHLGTVQRSAIAHQTTIDPNQELIAIGVSNLSAGALRGFVVTGSLSKTTVNDSAGAQSEISGIVAAILVVITGLFLTPLFHNLPEATLGAIVIAAIWHIFDISAMKRYFRVSRESFALAVTALLGELVLNVLPGLLFAVGLSFVLLIYRSSRPSVVVLGRFPDQHTYADITLHPENKTVPGLLILRLDAQLFFANDDVLAHRLRVLVHTAAPPPRAVLLDLEATPLLDLPSADTLAAIARDLKARGITLLLARVRDPVLAMLRRSGAAAQIEETHIYRMVDEGVEDFLSWPEATE